MSSTPAAMPIHLDDAKETAAGVEDLEVGEEKPVVEEKAEAEGKPDEKLVVEQKAIAEGKPEEKPVVEEKSFTEKPDEKPMTGGKLQEPEAEEKAVVEVEPAEKPMVDENPTVVGCKRKHAGMDGEKINLPHVHDKGKIEGYIAIAFEGRGAKCFQEATKILKKASEYKKSLPKHSDLHENVTISEEDLQHAVRCALGLASKPENDVPNSIYAKGMAVLEHDVKGSVCYLLMAGYVIKRIAELAADVAEDVPNTKDIENDNLITKDIDSIDSAKESWDALLASNSYEEFCSAVECLKFLKGH